MIRIRTWLKHGKQVIRKLALRRETVRTLGDSELIIVIGGHDPNCTADTQPASGCAIIKNGTSVPVLK